MHLKENDKSIGVLNILFISVAICLAAASGILIFLSQLKNVSINYEGKTIVAKTMATTVEDVLKEKKIGYNNTVVYPNLKQRLSKQNNIINIVRTASIAKPIILASAVVPAATQPSVQPKVVTDKISKNSKKLNLESRTIVSDKLASADKTSVEEKTVVKAKKSKWKTYGTTIKNAKGEITTSRGDVIRYKRILDMHSTAYDSCYLCCGKHPGDNGYGITATGVRARPGIIAVDPRVIPLGSRVYVESTDGTQDYGYALAADTGGAIKGGIIDLYFNTHHEVDNWGRRNIKVYILE